LTCTSLPHLTLADTTSGIDRSHFETGEVSIRINWVEWGLMLMGLWDIIIHTIDSELEEEALV
jgi:hypothetical protein